MKRPPVNFRAGVDELRARAASRPRKPERDNVLAALHGPYEGLQSVAAQTLGAWGDRESVAALRSYVANIRERRQSGGILRAVSKALAECVEEEDAPWLLDFYFDPEREPDWYLALAMKRLPPQTTRARIVAEMRSQSGHCRYAAVLVADTLPASEQSILLDSLRDDCDIRIRGIVRWQQRQIDGITRS